MKYFPLIILLVLLSASSKAQTAGKATFAFLNMNNNARSLALGSNFISGVDRDLSAVWQNPAAINPLMHNHAFVSYNNYVSDINSGFFSYARNYKSKGTFVASIFYIDYGKFDGYTEGGVSTGTFSVKDQCFQLGYAKSVHEKFRAGASLKYIYSIYESYVSNGVSADLSGMYIDTANLLTVSAIATNIGFQTIPYGGPGETRQPLPFQMAVTVSKRLQHLPFKYNMVFHNLQKPDMRYSFATNVKDENGNPKIQKITMGDNIIRHITFGGELNFTKHFVLRFGYDHMRRKETSPEQKRGTTGFSWGLGFKISKFNFSYGSASLFPGQNSNQFSLLCNLGDFYKKKK